MPKLYIISDCNGAGKTTSSQTILPEILDCKEFVNADYIAAGLSPFQPDTAAIAAGRIMLERIKDLINLNVTFAIETTLSSKTLKFQIESAKNKGYEIVLLYFWLKSPELAIERICERVLKGGHLIGDEIVKRRYYRGLRNLFEIFIPLSDYWTIIDNTTTNPVTVVEKDLENYLKILDEKLYNYIKELANEQY